MPEHAPDAPLPHHIVVMGVSGSGKTTVGTELANLMGLVYLDGDDFHPQANINKMASGIPLDDADRWPWLRRVGNWLAEHGITRTAGATNVGAHQTFHAGAFAGLAAGNFGAAACG